MRRLRGEARVPCTSTMPAPMPADGSPDQGLEVKKGFFGMRRVEITRALPALAAKERWRSARRVRIGIPRVLNLYSTAPCFRTYFEALGIPKQNVVFCDATTEEMWVEGGKYGSIDPCYPSKVAQAHIHNLLFHQHTGRRSRSSTSSSRSSRTCRTSSTRHDGQRELPDRRRRARRHEGRLHQGGRLLRARAASSTSIRRSRSSSRRSWRKRMFETFGPAPRHHRGRERSRVPRGLEGARRIFESDVQEKGRAILETVEAENRVAILMLGRPYHSDPGLNHGIPEEFQVLGYPILSIRSIPKDARVPRSLLQGRARERADQDAARAQPRVAGELLGQQRAEGVGREFAAHHPNVVVLDLSSLQVRPRRADLRPHRRDHRRSRKTPYAALHDIDANKPGGSIKIRVKTYAHALKLHEERLEDVAQEARAARQRASTRSASSSSS